MVTTLARAIKRIGKMPNSRQREAARMLNIFASQDIADLSLTSSQVSEVKKRLSAKPRYASDVYVTKFFAKLGL